MEEAVSEISLPKQTGLLLPATGADGVGLIVTEVVPETTEQPGTLAATEYVPEPAVVIAAMIGFCRVEEKLFGPLQE